MKHSRCPSWTREDAIDLNYLFYLQQVERSLAEVATTIEAQNAHQQLARMYEEQIEQLTDRHYRFPPND